MADNILRHQHKMQRRYTFTKSKALVGLVLSTFFSIVLSTYFDEYGGQILKEFKYVLTGN